ncbi:MAG: EVE domain-containing protein [Flavobacteriales bacterium]|nr:EVE domain-containing protein [Flavobacteriales bacterium]MBP9178698.1 EVE domain-containing protein [Flavobacteriales bacterium]
MAKTNWQNARWIKKITRPDWELFFDACNEVIGHFDLGADSPLLAMNIHLNSIDGVLMNISNRATIDMHLGEGTQVMLMLPLGATKRVLNEAEVIETFGFSRPATANGTRVTMDTFRNKLSLLLPEIEEATKQLLARSKSSPFRKHHIPDLYRMATDADFREKALDFLLEDKGAWPGSTDVGETNYWIFQANPKWYDAVGALRDNAVDRWTVAAHKQLIKPGDKAIIWVTGPEAGCYALVTITSAVASMPNERPAYTVNSSFNSIHDRVLVTIDQNLWDRPILENSIDKAKLGLMAGNQGTTFRATKEQYDFFLQRSTDDQTKTMHDLNTILYGPPGTGKTYHTVVSALAILENRSLDSYQDEPRSELRTRFERLSKERRILMTSFHQSMSYEEFIEGIKPESDKETGQVSYFIEPGVFKRISVEAAYEYVKATRSTAQPDVPFDELFAQYTEFLEEELAANKSPRIPSRSGKELQVVDISDRGNIILKHVNSTTTRNYVISLERLRALNAAFDDLDTIENIDREFRRVIGGSNATAYWAVLSQVRKMKPTIVKDTSADVEDLLFIDKLPHVERLNWFDRSLNDRKVNDYVLIIDEINRGNIASIFGELITLIEVDKRAFRLEAARVVLPYSKTLFSVPPNLHIIGTMNTADRSVEALDTALRRRFSFVEMPSRPELVQQPEGFTIELQPLLAAINGRIERLLDKDHHIGHSYFMGIHRADDPEHALRLVFKNKVLPLLEEYFYGDPRKLGAVLGPHWVKKREGSQHKLFGKFDIDDAAKDVFDVRDPMEVGLDDFAGIYE